MPGLYDYSYDDYYEEEYRNGTDSGYQDDHDTYSYNYDYHYDYKTPKDYQDDYADYDDGTDSSTHWWHHGLPEPLSPPWFALVLSFALLPALAYFFLVIRAKEGHKTWLYQTTVNVLAIRLLFPIFLGSFAAWGLDALCLLLIVASAVTFHCKGAVLQQHICDYFVSAFTSTNECAWQRWLKFYSVVLLYVGCCPLLFVVISLDTEQCCPGMRAIPGVYVLGYAVVLTLCTAFEALRKTANNAADASAAERRHADVHMNEAASKEEQESLIKL